MLIPSTFGESLSDDFSDYSFGNHRTFDIVNIDIKDTENGYEITMGMPDAKKEDIKAELRDGYLTIQATANSSKDEKGSGGTYIRRERHTGSCSRSFYVGDTVTRGDIKARFEDDILKVLAPKRETRLAVEKKRYTAIEGQHNR